ncbi:methyltransferase domain-containing protein [Clostridiaceae bacterium M8S5]|nr:methyltransferase domain-containing protein [Clostridiaceae bacterium M8S5]
MDNIVRDYYDSIAQNEYYRLSSPYSVVEFKSTLYLIDKYFPSGGELLDVGSGPGRYSLEMLKKGYKVTLMDISKNELDIARENITEAGFTDVTYLCKDALELDQLEDEKYDAVLVMGPLYHLHESEERLKVLSNTKRILKKNGVALIAYINTWGVLKASLYECPDMYDSLETFDNNMKGDLQLSEKECFTKAYMTIPPLAIKEVEKSGFEIVSYAGAESFISGLHIELMNLEKYMTNSYESYITKAAQYCELPQYRDAAEHLHIIVKK